MATTIAGHVANALRRERAIPDCVGRDEMLTASSEDAPNGVGRHLYPCEIRTFSDGSRVYYPTLMEARHLAYVLPENQYLIWSISQRDAPASEQEA